MTKKDFIIIAAAVNRFAQGSVVDGNKVDISHLLNLVDVLTLALQETNPRFDATRFRVACVEGVNLGDWKEVETIEL